MQERSRMTVFLCGVSAQFVARIIEDSGELIVWNLARGAELRRA